MRTFFLLLLLANLGFFAWANFIAESDTQSDPRPQARQIAPEKLRIVPPTAAPAQARSAPPVTVPIPVTRIACLEWGEFSTEETSRAAELLAPLGLDARLTKRETEDGAGWWVFIPSRGSREDAQKKTAELKALGVEEYFIVQDEGPMRYAVSLGVFKTEAAATNRLEALRERRVRTAQVGRRDTPARKTYFQIRAVEDELAAKLRALAASFVGTEVRECAVKPG